MITTGNKRLKIICKRNLDDRCFVNYRLYPLFYCEDLWISAYEKLKSNKGALTPGVGKQSLDGFSLEKIRNLIQLFREEKWNPKPARRIMIPKPGKKVMRPLSIQGPVEKVVQEIVRRILEAIFEPVFLDVSHGFRPGKSCHSALSQVEKKFQGMDWVIEGDITGCYDNIPHSTLINILRKRICDERFISLIWKFLRGGYLYSGEIVTHPTLIGTPQGSIVSPLLANIYLNELDHWVSDLKSNIYKSDSGLTLTRTREMKTLRSRIGKIERALKKAISENQRQELIRQLKALKNESLNTNFYEHFSKPKRIQYVRYANDWILGIYGPKSMARDIKDRLSKFLYEELGLELNPEKTHITDVRRKLVLFLGYHIHIPSNRKILKVRASSGRTFLKRTTGHLVKLLVPMDRVIFRLHQKGFCTSNGFPTSHKRWSSQDDVEIVRAFRSVLYGLVNYYSGSSYQHCLGRIDYILRYSCAKTLAHKHNSSCSKIFKEFGKELVIPGSTVALKKKQYTNSRKRWSDSSKILGIVIPHLGRLTRSV
uniref:Putative reverse transcriptase and intron maturase n=1 Tax=Tydemania expeditionis TaxID=325645 RepID=A0A0D6E1H1_TYDEX|nr:putative reverse transcriptase and intron maturase [Tydemania expeditionis]CEO91066.1 putative reverse transcriptase and intron maturase [Tydemania expeditionis]